MPSSAFPDPDIVDGPRKRRPTERVLENGDPLSHKRSKTTTGNKSTASVHRRVSVEDFEEPAPAPRNHPRNPSHILEASDGSDDAANVPKSDMPTLEPIEASSTESTDDEDSDESDDDEPELIDDTTELRMYLVKSSRSVY
jgi:hypothetical protein